MKIATTYNMDSRMILWKGKADKDKLAVTVNNCVQPISYPSSDTVISQVCYHQQKDQIQPIWQAIKIFHLFMRRLALVLFSQFLILNIIL